MITLWTESGAVFVRQNGNTFWTEQGAVYEGDVVLLQIDVSDALTLGEFSELLAAFVVSDSDPIGIGETVELVLGAALDEEDAIGLGESAELVLGAALDEEDALGLGETVELVSEAVLDESDAVGIGELVELVLEAVLDESEADAVGIGELVGLLLTHPERVPSSINYQGPICSTVDGDKLVAPTNVNPALAASGPDIRPTICGDDLKSCVESIPRIDPLCNAFTKGGLPRIVNGGGDMNIPDDTQNPPNPPPWIFGCTDPEAENYDPTATLNDGSCEYPVPVVPVPGCTDPTAANYNPAATVDNGTCLYPGCTDPAALNYQPGANQNNGTCIYGNDELFVRAECLNYAEVPNSVSYVIAANTFAASSKAIANNNAIAYWEPVLEALLNCEAVVCIVVAGASQYGWLPVVEECAGGEWFEAPDDWVGPYIFQA